VIPASVVALLQAHLDGLNKQTPPDYDPPWTSAVFRHPCRKSRVAKHTGRPTSAAIPLTERYLTLREVVITDGDGEDPASDFIDQFAIIFREGVCGRCGQTARSSVGRIVATAERPPLEGRVSRE
jgi:hypothetical protein